MARTAAKKNGSPEIEVMALQQETVTFCVKSITPFYCNRVAEKAKRELLLPRGRMTTAQKSANLKHDPLSEFRNSPYVQKGDAGPTRILMMATAFKGAIGQAAIDMPTAVARAQIDRLTYCVDQMIPIWGIPLLDMAVVRSADIGHTPDIRTRAFLPRWASRVRVRYTLPMLSAQSVSTLLSASGQICGIGDFRQQKGKGSNGLFTICDEDDPEYLEILAEGGREAQDAAFAEPDFSNGDSEDLYTWYVSELQRRGTARQAPEEQEEDAEEENGAIGFGEVDNGNGTELPPLNDK
jgi:hypothetical protein